MAGLLGGLGVAALTKSASGPPRMFASIPLLFAVQQAAEGVVWLTVGEPQPSTLHLFAVSAFLGFALVLWTTWLPLSLALVERHEARQRLLAGLFLFGVTIAAYAGFSLIQWQPSARIVGHSIAYDHRKAQDGAGLLLYLGVYAIPTVVPFFVSTMVIARAIGTTLAASLVITLLVRRDALTSVWCFFAAVLSGLVLIAVARTRAMAQATLAGHRVGFRSNVP